MFQLLIKAIRLLYRLIYSIYLDCVYQLHGIEGINRVMLRTFWPKYVLTKFGANIGEGTIVYPHIFIHAAQKDYSNLVVGKKCRILRDCFLDLTERIELCDTAHIGLRVSVITHLNVGDSALKDNIYPNVSKAVKIGKGAVTCTGAVILQGVIIGDYSVVGAGAVVSTPVAPYSVVVGNPGRTVRKLVKIE